MHISAPAGEHSCTYLPGLANTHAHISSGWRTFMHVPAWPSVHQCTYLPVCSGVHSCSHFLTCRTSYHYLPCLAHNNVHCTVHTHALPANMSINANDPSLSHINTPKIITPLLPTLISWYSHTDILIIVASFLIIALVSICFSMSTPLIINYY
jgi:hypothetical protein